MASGFEGTDAPPVVELDTLAARHPGITVEIGAAYGQAAAVCLSRHHAPPARIRASLDADDARDYVADWTTPSDRARAAWANADDATRDGAYGVVLAVADSHLGLVALGQTTVGSGADYWIGPPGALVNPTDGLIDLEGRLRLEISGIDRCRTAAQLSVRVDQKVEQARRGASNRPALAGVVAFNILRVVFRSVE